MEREADGANLDRGDSLPEPRALSVALRPLRCRDEGFVVAIDQPVKRVDGCRSCLQLSNPWGMRPGHVDALATTDVESVEPPTRATMGDVELGSVVLYMDADRRGWTAGLVVERTWAQPNEATSQTIPCRRFGDSRASRQTPQW